MTAQSSFMMVAPLHPPRIGELRRLLSSMNRVPGCADPDNNILPFSCLEDLHFARLVILEDKTLDDINTAYGLPKRDYPTYLAFLGDFDGDAGRFLKKLVDQTGDGLRRIFSFCEDFKPDSDLLRWMKDHEHPPATMYVNWAGRTMRQIREENALRNAIQTYLQDNTSALESQSPRAVHAAIEAFVRLEVIAGRLKLTSNEATPFIRKLRNVLNLIGVPLVLLFFTPLFVLCLPFFLFQLRRREKRDLEIAPRVDAAHARKLAELEDHDVTNQFTAMGTLKPGVFRRWTLVFYLWLVQYTTRHIYNRGQLARVPSIHFARWVFLDNKKRLIFCSNYDGSLESYMDDFINKVAFGLNLVFSNGIGYPQTDWLVFRGAKDEQRFKNFIRRHELATEVWYNAHPGLTNFDLRRNSLIRQGLEQKSMTDAEIKQWLALF
jgi:hypothetical protein